MDKNIEQIRAKGCFSWLKLCSCNLNVSKEILVKTGLDLFYYCEAFIDMACTKSFRKSSSQIIGLQRGLFDCNKKLVLQARLVGQLFKRHQSIYSITL